MELSNPKIDEIRKRCWDEALFNYGTAYIFEQRAHYYRRLLRILTFLGIAVPITIGSIYLSFSNQTQLLNTSLVIAGTLGTVQLIGSAWSLSAKWEEAFGYALESLNANQHLSSRFERLAQFPPDNIDELQIQFNMLVTENSFRTEQDNKQGISDKEKRKGMRAALRKFQRACAGCKIVPTSMKSTTCDICGNF